ncbi:hypothetical protein BH23ACT3_BH23ACT3_23080 [soil metagenome]
MERTTGRVRTAATEVGFRQLAGRLAPVTVLGAALVASALARRQAPWISSTYLVALITLGGAIWALARWRPDPSRRMRRVGIVATATVLLALLPVPWMTAGLDEPPGTAWRLDGRLHVDGERIDPAGEWYWLTVGRPPLVAEVVAGVVGIGPGTKSLVGGIVASRPEVNEPAAVAVGLRAAGRAVEFRLVVELSRPSVDELPDRLEVATLNGIAVTTRTDWERAVGSLGARNTIVDADGASHEFRGRDLPYERTDLLDVPVGALDAVIGGRLARTPVGRWFRGLALGRSHGLMVALVTYAHVAGEDLARGRTITGTGGVRGDGSVVRIGGLRSKASAAARLGADVLLVPAEQKHELDGLDLGSTRVIAVSHLDEAIEALQDESEDIVDLGD